MHKNNLKAPAFSLTDTNGEQVSLDQLLNKKKCVVLLFFPLAFSSVCTKELCSVRDNLKIYNSLNAEIAGISVDSFFTLKAFKEAQNLNYNLLSDFNKEVSEKLGVLNKDYYGMKGVSKRAVFVINREGRIIYSEILEDAGKLPDMYKVQEVLTD
ncbi:MAG: redoxin domain-containing protein [Balneolaceae bacterium]